MSTKKSEAVRFLEKLTGGGLTLGGFLEAVRLGEELTQPDLARKLGISKSHLNDIEKGRKAVSPDRAARFAKILGYSQARLVPLRRVERTYAPRAPVAGVLYDVVRQHLSEFLAAVDTRTDGLGLPAFVTDEFRKFLGCGVLSRDGLPGGACAGATASGTPRSGAAAAPQIRGRSSITPCRPPKARSCPEAAFPGLPWEDAERSIRLSARVTSMNEHVSEPGQALQPIGCRHRDDTGRR